jgi:putative endonuclease
MKTTLTKTQIGQQGEEIATQFLLEKNFKILARNWRSGRSELDIIAYDHQVLVFVEVKTRSSAAIAPPEAAVSAKKQQMLVAAAIDFMHHIGHEWAIRFDVLGIVLNKTSAPKIEHHKDAFFPGL